MILGRSNWFTGQHCSRSRKYCRASRLRWVGRVQAWLLVDRLPSAVSLYQSPGVAVEKKKMRVYETWMGVCDAGSPISRPWFKFWSSMNATIHIHSHICCLFIGISVNQELKVQFWNRYELHVLVKKKHTSACYLCLIKEYCEKVFNCFSTLIPSGIIVYVTDFTF